MVNGLISQRSIYAVTNGLITIYLTARIPLEYFGVYAKTFYLVSLGFLIGAFGSAFLRTTLGSSGIPNLNSKINTYGLLIGLLQLSIIFTIGFFSNISEPFIFFAIGLSCFFNILINLIGSFSEVQGKYNNYNFILITSSVITIAPIIYLIENREMADHHLIVLRHLGSSSVAVLLLVALSKPSFATFSRSELKTFVTKGLKFSLNDLIENTFNTLSMFIVAMNCSTNSLGLIERTKAMLTLAKSPLSYIFSRYFFINVDMLDPKKLCLKLVPPITVYMILVVIAIIAARTLLFEFLPYNIQELSVFVFYLLGWWFFIICGDVFKFINLRRGLISPLLFSLSLALTPFAVLFWFNELVVIATVFSASALIYLVVSYLIAERYVKTKTF